MQEVKTVLNIKLRTDCNNKDLSLKDKSFEDVTSKDDHLLSQRYSELHLNTLSKSLH